MAIAKISAFTGTQEPMGELWQFLSRNGVLIASGGKLQYYDGVTLSTVDSSPDCDVVTKKDGRVVIGSSANDRIYFSGIGDHENWKIEGEDWTESDAVWIDVGNRSGGHTNALVMLNRDLIVFKTDGVAYRIVGSFPDWQVQEIGRNLTNINRFTAVQEGNDIFFVDRNYGIHSLTSVAEYGDIKVSRMGRNINEALVRELGSEARLWSVRSRGEIWVKPDAGSKKVYVYNLTFGGWTIFTFPLEIVSCQSIGAMVHLSLVGEDGLNPNGFVYAMDRNVSRDFETESIDASLVARPISSAGDAVLLKKLDVSLDGDANAAVDVNGIGMIGFTLNGMQRKATRQMMAAPELYVRIQSSDGRMKVRQAVVEYVDL